MFSLTSLRLRSSCGLLTRMGTVTSTTRSLSRCSSRRRWKVQKFQWKCASSPWTAAWCEAPLVMIDRFPFRSNPSFPSENLNKSWHPPVSGCLAVCAVLISSPLSDVRLGPGMGRARHRPSLIRQTEQAGTQHSDGQIRQSEASDYSRAETYLKNIILKDFKSYL